MATIKTTMVAALAFVTEHGNMSKENLEVFTAEYCTKKAGSVGSGEPRVLVKLYDEDYNIVGRRDSTLELWFAAEHYNGDVAKSSITRMTNKVKAKAVSESKKIEREAKEILVEAKTLEDPLEKLAAYEAYDAEMEKAAAIRKADVTLDMVDLDGAVAYNSGEELAEALGLETFGFEAKKEVKEDEDTVDMSAE